MEIPEPPSSTFCTPCMSQITWEFSKLRMAWVSFVVDRDPDILRRHKCKPTQHQPVWPPTPEYLAAKAALTQTHDRNEENE